MSPGNNFRIEFIFNLIKMAPLQGVVEAERKVVICRGWYLVSDRDLKQDCDRITPRPFFRMCSFVTTWQVFFFLIFINILENFAHRRKFQEKCLSNELTSCLIFSQKSGRKTVRVAPAWTASVWNKLVVLVWTCAAFAVCSRAQRELCFSIKSTKLEKPTTYNNLTWIC